MTSSLPGGSTCDARQLVELTGSHLPTLSTGMRRIEEAIGGLRPGAVWAIVGAAGVGVTVLATHLAVRAATHDRAMSTLVNGHLAAADIEHRVGHAIATGKRVRADRPRTELEQVDMSYLSFAEWMPLALDDSAMRDRRLVVFDTVDEMYPAVTDDYPPTATQRLTGLRLLRTVARGHASSAVLTCRVAPPDRGLRSTTDAWAQHAWHEAITDVCDVHLTIGSSGSESIVTVESRSMGDTSCSLANLRRQLSVTETAG